MWGHFRPVCVNRIGMERCLMSEQTEQEKIIRALRAVSKAGSSDINCLARRAVDEIERLRTALRNVLDDSSEQSGAKAAPLPAEVSATEHSGQ